MRNFFESPLENVRFHILNAPITYSLYTVSCVSSTCLCSSFSAVLTMDLPLQLWKRVHSFGFFRPSQQPSAFLHNGNEPKNSRQSHWPRLMWTWNIQIRNSLTTTNKSPKQNPLGYRKKAKKEKKLFLFVNLSNVGASKCVDLHVYLPFKPETQISSRRYL